MKMNKEERGVALIFAIGIVALMMMLVITYATTSITGKDVAINSYAQFSARLLAESGVLNVKKILDSQKTDTYAKIIDLRSGGDQGLSDSKLKDILSTIKNSMIKDYEKDDMYTVIRNSFDNPNDDNCPKWELIKDTCGKIKARFAYTTYKPMGLLDPLKLNGTGSWKNISEKIKKDNILNWSATKDEEGNATTVSTKVFDNITFPSDTEINRPFVWFDSMFIQTKDGTKKLPICRSTSETKNYDDLYNKSMNRYLKSPASPYTGEYFWYEKQRYYRFNLNRSDWNTLTVDDLLNMDNLKPYDKDSTTDDSTYIPGKPATSRDTKCIPWLAKGTLPESQRKQIAANFIAFMATVHGKEDSIDSSLIKDDGTNPYFANLKAPYLNEIGIKVTLAFNKTYIRNQDDPEDKKNKYTITANITICTELRNFFKGLSGDYTIEDLFSSFKITYPETKDVPKGDIDLKEGINEKVKGTQLKITNGDETFFIVQSEYPSTKEIESTEDNLSLEMTLEITPGKVKIKKDSKTEDFCILDTENLKTSYKESFSDSNQTDVWRSWQVADARNNLTVSREITPANEETPAVTESNWNLISPSEDDKGRSKDLSMTFPSDSSGTVTGRENTICKIDDDPFEKSIYESPFEFPSVEKFNPGMLGFISRGENYRTLNLSVYKNIIEIHQSEYEEEGKKNHGYYKAGINSYDNGDAPLWDQIRWTNEGVGYEYGKININGIFRAYSTKAAGDEEAVDPRDNRDAAAALFMKKDSTDTTVVPQLAEKTTRFYDYTSAESVLAGNNKSELQSSPARQFEERISFLDENKKHIDLLNSKEQTLKQWLGLQTVGETVITKKEAEEKLGKFILMTTAGAAPFEADDTVYVLCVAQTVKDLGTFSGTTFPVWENKKITLKTAKAGEWDEGIDQVLGSQRIFAILQKNNQGKWVIVRMEYVD